MWCNNLFPCQQQFYHVTFLTGIEWMNEWKDNLFPRSGPTILRQLNPINRKGTLVFFLIFFFNYFVANILVSDRKFIVKPDILVTIMHQQYEHHSALKCYHWCFKKHSEKLVFHYVVKKTLNRFQSLHYSYKKN